MTVPEVRRLLAALAGDPARHAFRRHWSRWRRQRQAEARRSHHKRRLGRPDPEVPL